MISLVGARYAVTLSAVAIVAMVGLYLPIQAGDFGMLGAAFAGSWLLLLFCLIRSDRGGVYRPCAAYLMLFGLFHGGLIISAALQAPEWTPDDSVNWLFGPHTVDAVKLAILGMAAFALAAEFAGGDAAAPVVPQRGMTTFLRSSFATVGLVLEISGVSLFVLTVFAAGGLSLIVGGYDAFLQVAGSNPQIGYATAAVGLGAVLAVAGGGRGRTAAWSVFLAYAALAFPIGLRGEVLFGLVGLLAVDAHLGRRIKPVWTLAGSAFVLVLIALVRQTRTLASGASLEPASPSAMVLDAVAEMGYSLKPAVVVVGWHVLGESYMNGATLFAVPLRLGERLFGSTPPAYDPRLFNVEIGQRVGPIGGSPIAEAYHNFGGVGVVLFMLALGVVIGLLERQRADVLGAAILGAVLVPLFTQVRNSFASVPADIGLGLAIVLACYLYASVREQRTLEPTRGLA